MRRLIPRVLGYLRPHRHALAWALGQVVLMSAFELLKPWPLKIVIDSVLGQRPAPLGWAAGWSPADLLLAACAGFVVIHAVDRRARRAEQLHHDRHRPADGGGAAGRSVRASAPPVARLSQPGPGGRSPLPGHRRHAGAADPHDELPVSRRDRGGDARGHGRDHVRARLEADAPVARRLPPLAPRHRAARLRASPAPPATCARARARCMPSSSARCRRCASSRRSRARTTSSGASWRRAG